MVGVMASVMPASSPCWDVVVAVFTVFVVAMKRVSVMSIWFSMLSSARTKGVARTWLSRFVLKNRTMAGSFPRLMIAKSPPWGTDAGSVRSGATRLKFSKSMPVRPKLDAKSPRVAWSSGLPARSSMV